MSSNPLMMGYEGGDLLLTGIAWPTVGLLPRHVCAGYRWWPAAPVSDERALEVAWPPAFAIQIDVLYLLPLPEKLTVGSRTDRRTERQTERHTRFDAASDVSEDVGGVTTLIVRRDV